ncbi:inositol monophosphatase family protein [Amycolatopsis sp. PS_44_ISF1]|uniref:inositol monophosphatase family protein n=1 Tax=Amycolatopsis sp. PS_44_ISF1 TaxID=2974917 RepID=UPI0028E08550|nr:inositol monophosphatase family protein [Amycolatopsis sp. PS_44_ISF1]MDT8915114.1 inositol monophosphatase family protein [Amycolatopsis sp. PS_44_ISF1]
MGRASRPAPGGRHGSEDNSKCDSTTRLPARNRCSAPFPSFGAPASGTRWVLDPVDGTANLTHDIPLTGISLALVADEDPLLGVIALPQLGRTYWAADGLGACRDGHPIRIAGPARLDEAMIAIGDYGAGPDTAVRNAAMLEIHAALAPRAQRIRMLGTAAADLALVADSAFGASITLGNRTWDMAAGAVIAREAGAHVTDLDGTDHTTASRCTIAAAPALIDDILGIVQHASTVTGFTGQEDLAC